ncbi:hypothetical protein CEXT_744871 [Caerostris extrusa]|uniref:Uncharacterized protein n=1 Tax=Caerostris extrusa TaxID=172846 RepID=A0AAV4ST18_CAEEX|nr:hypothetical protein CEXT_744871 [Caerostris extrusa]
MKSLSSGNLVYEKRPCPLSYTLMRGSNRTSPQMSPLPAVFPTCVKRIIISFPPRLPLIPRNTRLRSQDRQKCVSDIYIIYKLLTDIQDIHQEMAQHHLVLRCTISWKGYF